jgi:hypothetical protein
MFGLLLCDALSFALLVRRCFSVCFGLSFCSSFGLLALYF